MNAARIRCGAFLCALGALLLGTAGCGLPRDPGDSLRQIRNGTLRVGVIENPPWVVLGPGEPAGVEPLLLRELAAELNARIEWVPGPEQELLRALERHALHVVVGGFADRNPWAKQLGKTRPFHTTRLIVAARPGTPPLMRLDGAEVAAPAGSAAAGFLREQGARRRDPGQPGWQYAALPGWRMAGSGLTATGQVLHEDRRVMLIPKGENGWLTVLERFLDRQRARIEPLLRQQADAHP